MDIQGKRVSTPYGLAQVIEYDINKEKYKVEYIGQGAIGFLSAEQLSLTS